MSRGLFACSFVEFGRPVPKVWSAIARDQNGNKTFVFECHHSRNDITSVRNSRENMGWQITSVNYDKPDYVEYEIVKGDD